MLLLTLSLINKKNWNKIVNYVFFYKNKIEIFKNINRNSVL